MLAEPSRCQIGGEEKKTGKNLSLGNVCQHMEQGIFPERKDMVVKAGSQLPKLKEQRSLGIIVDLFFSPASLLCGPSGME